MADSKRGFSPSDVPEKLEDYHGGCRLNRLTPDLAEEGVESVNLFLSFDQALRLSTAIQAGILRLNRYNRATNAGKDMGLCLTVRTDTEALSVIETSLGPAKKREGRRKAADSARKPDRPR